jgi:hypothetical protein
MARPPKPTAELEAKGAFAKNPNRTRFDAPTTGKIPRTPPEHLDLDEFESAAWREIVPLIPPTINAGNDIFVVEMLSRLVGEVRRTKKLTAQAAGRIEQYLGRLGMTASGRAQLATPTPPDTPDPLDEFAPRPAVTASENASN